MVWGVYDMRGLWHGTNKQIKESWEHVSFLNNMRVWIVDHFKVTIEENHGFWAQMSRKILRIPWTRKIKNADILGYLNIGENWFMDSSVAWKLWYSGHVKNHSGLESTVKEGVVSVRGRQQAMWSWVGGGHWTMKTLWAWCAWCRGTGNQLSPLGGPWKKHFPTKNILPKSIHKDDLIMST